MLSKKKHIHTHTHINVLLSTQQHEDRGNCVTAIIKKKRKNLFCGTIARLSRFKIYSNSYILCLIILYTSRKRREEVIILNAFGLLNAAVIICKEILCEQFIYLFSNSRHNKYTKSKVNAAKIKGFKASQIHTR